MKPITVTIPVKTISEANVREHHMKRARRTKAQRYEAWLVTFTALRYYEWPLSVLRPLTITLTRISKKSLDDDNLAVSQKHVRDGVADALGLDDADVKLTWRYAQEKGEYAVRIEVRAT